MWDSNPLTPKGPVLQTGAPRHLRRSSVLVPDGGFEPPRAIGHAPQVLSLVCLPVPSTRHHSASGWLNQHGVAPPRLQNGETASHLSILVIEMFVKERSVVVGYAINGFDCPASPPSGLATTTLPSAWAGTSAGVPLY